MEINTCKYFDRETGCEKEKCICENKEKKILLTNINLINWVENKYPFMDLTDKSSLTELDFYDMDKFSNFIHDYFSNKIISAFENGKYSKENNINISGLEYFSSEFLNKK